MLKHWEWLLLVLNNTVQWKVSQKWAITSWTASRPRVRARILLTRVWLVLLAREAPQKWKNTRSWCCPDWRCWNSSLDAFELKKRWASEFDDSATPWRHTYGGFLPLRASPSWSTFRCRQHRRGRRRRCPRPSRRSLRRHPVVSSFLSPECSFNTQKVAKTPYLNFFRNFNK